MYYMLTCLSSLESHKALIDYEPDRPEGGLFHRSWNSGRRFVSSPPLPVIATIPAEQHGDILEFSDAALPLISKRLAEVLRSVGVSNVDCHEAEIHDEMTGSVHKTHYAFNLIGTIAAADLEKSKYSALDGPVLSVDFDSLVVDENKTRGALMFRLAESVNGIAVHESVKNAIEAAGIDTLTFIPPEEWVG